MENKPEINKSNSLSAGENIEVQKATIVKDPKSNMGLIIGLIIILIAAIGAGIYYYISSQKLAKEKEKIEIQLQQAYFDLDSIGSQLDERILTIKQLGGNVDSLVAVKAQLEEEKGRLRRREITQSKQIKTLSDRVGGYKELLLMKDKEIAQLKSMNTELIAENSELKEETNKLNKTLTTLSDEKIQLQEKVAAASQLKLEDFAVYAVNKKGKEYKNEFRNRQIEQLKIQFYLSENKVAPIEGKDIILRIIGIDNNVLFDVSKESGTFLLNSRDEFFTAKQEILYDRNKKLVTFSYDKGSSYDKGLYKVEVYTDNYLLGKGNFTVK